MSEGLGLSCNQCSRPWDPVQSSPLYRCVHDQVVVIASPGKIPPFCPRSGSKSLVFEPLPSPMGDLEIALSRFIAEAPSFPHRCSSAKSDDASSASGPRHPAAKGRRGTGAGRQEGPGRHLKGAWQWGGPGCSCLIRHVSVRDLGEVSLSALPVSGNDDAYFRVI